MNTVQYILTAYLLVINAVVDFAVLHKGIPIHHKQCFVGGIPIEEYFEMQKSMSPEEIRQEQYKRLQAARDELEAELEADEHKRKGGADAPDEIKEKGGDDK